MNAEGQHGVREELEVVRVRVRGAPARRGRRGAPVMRSGAATAADAPTAARTACCSGPLIPCSAPHRARPSPLSPARRVHPSRGSFPPLPAASRAGGPVLPAGICSPRASRARLAGARRRVRGARSFRGAGGEEGEGRRGGVGHSRASRAGGRVGVSRCVESKAPGEGSVGTATDLESDRSEERGPGWLVRSLAGPRVRARRARPPARPPLARAHRPKSPAPSSPLLLQSCGSIS
ncbi:hypothetical protein DMC30DRAFT_273660 [Rhodotorula diobovata]|uniref:Uncharacterized protein n=1 Tax=Rhodotorula diobovata TaxID=5288 RepID=A0A5C5FVF1_9BASI|nr:hypothetical protein DMC30DRAFT_273660 [Rhodotorula diobovata]